MRRSVKVVLGCALAAATVVGQASGAVAEPPTRDVQDASFDAPLIGWCPFTVDVHFEQPKARTTTFYAQDGEIAGYLLTGAATITVSNADVADGPSLTFNISGPGKIDSGGNLIGSGPWLLGRPDDGTTEPFLIIPIGHFVLGSTGDGVSSGRVVDLCAALA